MSAINEPAVAAVVPARPVFAIREVCEIAGFSRSYFNEIAKHGGVKTIRFGRSVRVTRDELLRLLREGTG